MARRETTILLRGRSSLISLNSSSLPSRCEVSRIGRTSTSEPGRNARMFSRSTVKPPLTLPEIIPITVSLASNACSNLIHASAALAFSRDNCVAPNPSSSVSRETSTKSPTETVISPFSFMNSATGIAPSDFRPALTITTSGPTLTTVPVTILPGCIGVAFRLSSKRSAKLSLIINILDPVQITESPVSPAIAGN